MAVLLSRIRIAVFYHIRGFRAKPRLATARRFGYNKAKHFRAGSGLLADRAAQKVR
jgi:hypothetical protein